MAIAYNGMPAADLGDVRWQKSWRSNPNGECVELAALPNGEIAVRNSRFPAGPVLLYTQAEITAFVAGAKDGDFDNLVNGTTNLPAGNGPPGRCMTATEPNQALPGRENTAGSGLLLNCHRSLFRDVQIAWETGPHPAKINKR
jgi:hypothetical protein